MKTIRLLLAVTLILAVVGSVIIAQAPPAGGGAQGAGAGAPPQGGGAPGGGAPGGGGAGRGGGGGQGRGGRGGGGGISPQLVITVDGYEDGAMMPAKYSGRGGNVSPKISWTGAPPTTQAFAIIFHDMDPALANGTEDVLHWMVWDIPATATGLPEAVPAGDLPDGTRQGRGITGQNAYFGPGPPAPRTHHYVFEVYALNAKLGLPATATRAEVLAALQGKVVGKGVYVGRFRAP